MYTLNIDQHTYHLNDVTREREMDRLARVATQKPHTKNPLYTHVIASLGRRLVETGTQLLEQSADMETQSEQIAHFAS